MLYAQVSSKHKKHKRCTTDVHMHIACQDPHVNQRLASTLLLWLSAPVVCKLRSLSLVEQNKESMRYANMLQSQTGALCTSRSYSDGR
jgi:hypothetical protein